jgi:hypothetical protein
MEKAAGDGGLADTGIGSEKKEAGSGAGKRNRGDVAGQRALRPRSAGRCRDQSGEGSQEPIDVLFGVLGGKCDTEACLTRRDGGRADGLQKVAGGAERLSRGEGCTVVPKDNGKDGG